MQHCAVLVVLYVGVGAHREQVHNRHSGVLDGGPVQGSRLLVVAAVYGHALDRHEEEENSGHVALRSYVQNAHPILVDLVHVGAAFQKSVDEGHFTVEGCIV